MATGQCVVFGAAMSGNGEAITRRLLNEGYAVIGTYEAENVDQARALQSEFGATGRLELTQVDHSSRESLYNFISGVTAPISGIVYAQFYFNMEDPDHFDFDLWDRSIAVNLTAPNFVIHELGSKLDNGSSIVIITSTEGFIGSFGATAYAACKAAIHNLVKSFANNLGTRNIRANAVAAGWIGGVMDTDEVFNMSRRITPLGRLGSSEEVAAVATFLVSTESSFVNGTVITADGGYTGVDTIAKYEFEQSKKNG